MNNVLTVVADSNIDNNLVGLWDAFRKYNGKWIKGQHYVEFDRDEDATWFLVRWS